MSESTPSSPPIIASAETPLARVTAILTLEPEVIRVSFTLTSLAATDLLVFDATTVITPTGEVKYAPTMAHIWFEAPHAVVLMLGVPALPIRKSVEEARAPWIHRVVSGGTLRRDLRLALPLDESSPYYAPPTSRFAFRAESIHNLGMIIEYAETPQGVRLSPVDGMDGLYRLVEGPIQLKDVRIDWHLPADLRGRRRSDLFEPFRRGTR